MLAEMTEPLAPAAPAPRRIGLRLALAGLALPELFDATMGAWLVGDLSGLSAIVKLNQTLHPVLALSALVFAALGHVRHAILALGAGVILAWLTLIPAVGGHGYVFSGLLPNSAQTIAFPLIGVCAIALAARGERLGLATLLVGIPILSNLFNELAFLIGVIDLRLLIDFPAALLQEPAAQASMGPKGHSPMTPRRQFRRPVLLAAHLRWPPSRPPRPAPTAATTSPSSSPTSSTASRSTSRPPTSSI